MQREGLADLRWVRSSTCNGGTCVEAAAVDQGATIALRDGKNPQTVMFVAPAEWGAFLDGITAGEFDRLSME